MRLLFLTDNFPPEVNAPASRTFEHCREWSALGHHVTVITCAPNFPKGKVFGNYRNALWQREWLDDIEVIRVWTYIASNEGFTKRILDYLSFMVAAIISSVFVRRPDMVIGTSPQFFTACAAFVVSRYKRVPFVFEVRDIWPESITAVGAMKDSILIKMLEKIELFLYAKADQIITVTHSLKDVLVKRGVDDKKIGVITNGVNCAQFKPREKDHELQRYYHLEDKYVAGYIGTHGMAHALGTIVEAAKMAQKNSDPIHFLFIGDGAEKGNLVEKVAEFGLTNVTFIDTVTKQEVPRYWSLLDVCIIHLKNIELFRGAIPSKIFECMAMGIPVLHGVLGESAEIVENFGVGRVFEPENAVDLYNKLIEMSKTPNFKEQCRHQCLAAAKNYDRKNLASSMLDKLISKPG